MKSHWNSIGFTPTSFKLDTGETVDDAADLIHDVPLKDNEKFTPTHRKVNPTPTTCSKFSGVVIRNLPLTISETDTKAFLVTK